MNDELQATLKDGDEQLFVPQIHKKSQKIQRESKIDDLLYSDAKRRRNKVQENLQKSYKTQEPPKTTTKIVSSKSQKLVIQRFMKEFAQVIEEKEHKEDEIISKKEANELMNALGFILDMQSKVEESLMEEIWHHLSQNDEADVTVLSLKVFMCCIQNFDLPWMKAPESEEKPKLNKQKVGTVDDGKYLVHSNEISFITKHFSSFNQNRQNYVVMQRKMQRQMMAQEQSGPDFKPKILKKSE